MNDFRLRMSMSSQGDRNRPFFSRQQLNRPIPQTSHNQKRSDKIKVANKLDQPGLYFDINQAKDVVNFQNPLINRTQSHQSMRAKSGFAFSEKSQKLYSPYEYLHYATKVNGSKEQYLNALQQLGYEQAPNFQARPLNEIINNTNQIISKSYSVKYMGIIDGNMGILTNRKKISSKQKQRLSFQLQHSQQGDQDKQQDKNQTNHFKYGIQPSGDTSQDENFQRYQNQQLTYEREEEEEDIPAVQQVSLDDKKLKVGPHKEVANPSEIQQKQINKQEKQMSQQQIKQKQQQPQLAQSQSTIGNKLNINSQPPPVNSQQPVLTEPQPQKAPHPENYSTYLVGKYSLPRGLKSIKKMRDPTILEQKLKLEQWHAEKIKVFEVGEQFGGGFSIQSSIPNKSSTSSNFFPQQTLSGQTKSNFMKTNIHPQSHSSARMKSSLYKKPLQNYEENAEEGICYAIIEQNPNSDAVSFSKLLQHIDQVDPQQILPRVLSANQLKNKQKPPGVTFEQNMQLFQRYQQLETKTFIRAASPNKSLSTVQ